MPAIQTQYDYHHSNGRPGLVYGYGQEYIVNRYVAAADIDFGRAVYVSKNNVKKELIEITQGSSVALDADANDTVGISIRDIERSAGKYKKGELVPVLERGKIFVQLKTASATSGIRASVVKDTGEISATHDATADVKQDNILTLGKADADAYEVVQILGLNQIGA